MRVNINSVDTSTADFKVGFFTIKPNERAIVRFLIDSDEDFDVVTLHNVEVDQGKTIRVDCIRDPHDPVSACPLCASNAKIDQRVFIRMLQYIPQNDGTYIPKCKIWDRSVRSDLITTLKTYLMDYGPLSQIICSVSRVGEGLNTKYTVSPNLPDANRYPLDASDFEGYDVCGTIVKEWTAEQMNDFLMTGNVPTSNKQQAEAASDSNDVPSPAARAYSSNVGPISSGVPSADVGARPRRVYN